MKRFIFLGILTLGCFCFSSCTQPKAQTQITEGWDMIPNLIKNIVEPQFPDTIYNILDYGAVNNIKTNSLPAILAAINDCNKNGGGKVLIPQGIYFLKGSIFLKSNVNLHLAQGARLEFSTKSNDYLPLVLTKWEGTECFNYSPLIYSYQSTNVAITGKGIIDGNGAEGFNKWKPHEKPAMDRLRQMGNDSIPVYERVFGEGWFLRPSMIQFLAVTMS